ncbi:MAG: hypothetical protein ABI182_03425 [Candidatus Baltobacteraceae bacterium]
MGRELHVHSHPSGVEHWRHLIEIVALAVAAFWGLYVFVYQERIKPANEPPEFQPAFTVEHATLRGGEELVKVDISAKNAGSEPLYVGGLIVNAYGIRFGSSRHVHLDAPRNGDADFSSALLPAHPSLLYSMARSFQPFGNPNSFINLQPATAYQGSFAFAVPSAAFEAVKLEWVICFSKLTNRRWPVSLKQHRDGSFWFEDSAANTGTGLICYDERDAYYPL